MCLAAVALAACQALVTSVPLSEQLAPLDMAMSESPETLEAQAQSGDGPSQLAMAIIYGHGLRGRAQDIISADQWRQRAQANHRYMPVTQYAAAFNGQPSRVNIVNMPVQAISSAQRKAIDACVALLSSQRVNDGAACGNPRETARRQAAWRGESRNLPGS